MFSYLIVALFALLSLSVSSRPLPRAVSSLTPCDLPTSTPYSVPTPTPTPTTDDCSDTTPSTPAPTTSTASATPTTTATPTTSVASTTATSSVPVSTSAALTTVSDTITGGPYTGGVATYFYQNGNPGACGQVNSDYAFICAMDQTRFGTSGPSSPLCGQQVKITNDDTGVSITVTIADDCPTCNNENSIDLSVGAFQALSSLSVGEFPITWSYV